MTPAQRALVLDCLDARECELLARVVRAEDRHDDRDLEHWRHVLIVLRGTRDAFLARASA